MFPPAPAFSNVRLATSSDVPRLGIVATAGFYYSPQFAWERAHHADYPHDTFLSYEKVFAEAIQRPKSIVIVVEDSYDPDESSKTNATIEPNDDYVTPSRGDRVVVGIASWTLQPHSGREGQFTNLTDVDDTDWSKFTGGLERDRDHTHLDILHRELAKAEAECALCCPMDIQRLTCIDTSRETPLSIP